MRNLARVAAALQRLRAAVALESRGSARELAEAATAARACVREEFLGYSHLLPRGVVVGETSARDLLALGEGLVARAQRGELPEPRAGQPTPSVDDLARQDRRRAEAEDALARAEARLARLVRGGSA